MTKDFLTKEGQKYNDFLLVTYRPIDELQATLRELVHVPTGAQVMHIENDDPENLFCLSFKTLPDSSNGAPHILEHTVLCGSLKFPVKDPFFSMNRRSLNTFMNALTGSDFTCYPAATQVEKDFYNLLEVYLDAVFHPELKELSFLQEGHRLEFEKPEDPSSQLLFKGIVYNEMKGAMSSVDSRIWHAMMAELVPDLTYAHNSGGEPKEIPNLTYKQLIDFHETFYHPSRCLFFFYGNFPLEKHLDFIEEHALKNIKKLSPIEGIGHQTRFEKPIKKTLTYPISEEEGLEDKYIHAFGWLTTPVVDQEEVLALTILDSILMDTDASPLKAALLDTELCIHADSYLDTEMTEIPFVLVLRGCDEKAVDSLQKTLFEALETISKDGIPYHLVEASIHQLEFSRMEICGDHSPFGLTLFMRSALAKQHGCDPIHSLSSHTLFQKLLVKAKDPRFLSPLIEKYFLNNPHFVRLSFSPDPLLSAKEAEEEMSTLKKIQNSLTEKETVNILEQTKKLESFQNEQETKQLECLPKLTLEDVPRETRDFSLTTHQCGNLGVFHHDCFTNHILYADLIFDLPPLTENELFDLQLFLILWPDIGAGSRSYIDNLEYVQAYTGGVGAHVSQHVQTTNQELSKPSIQLHGKALDRNAEKLFSLFRDMIENPHFHEKKRIGELIRKLATSLQNRLSRNAMRYASQLALASYSTPGYINEQWYGLSFYQNVQALNQNLKQQLPNLLTRLGTLQQKLLKNGPPKLVLSTDQSLFSDLINKQFYGLSTIPSLAPIPWEQFYTIPKIQDQARVIPSPVAFTVQGFSTIPYLHPDAPALQVSTALLENKVLHHRIREQGGAYGSGASYNSAWGNFYLYSYRDPHIAHTIRTFTQAATEIADGNFDERDLEEAKLGIIQHFDTPTSPGNRAMVAYNWLRDGKTHKMRQSNRDRILALTHEDIQKALKNHLLPQLETGTIVTFAGQELLNKELPLLDNKKIEILPIS